MAMTLGILSVPMKKTGFLRKLQGSVEIKDRFSMPTPIIAAEFAYTAEELATMPEKKRKRLLEKGKALLAEENVRGIVLTHDCADGMGVAFTEGNGTAGIPGSRMAECIAFGLECAGDALTGQIAYLSDREMKAVDFALMEQLCKKVRYICLLTEKTEKAEALGEKLFREYGVFPEIRPYQTEIPQSAALTADLDGGVLRLGRECVIDGVDFALDTHGYRVDSDAVLACVPELSERLPLLSWKSGKKRLTSKKISIII